MPPPYPVTVTASLPKPAARCCECRWISDDRLQRSQAHAHATATGHRVVIPLVGHVAFQPVLDHETEVTS